MSGEWKGGIDVRLDPVTRVSLTQAVVSRLKEQIENGVLRPGDKLPSERMLMESLGVGRSTIREALQSLAMMNLIDIQPGRGSFVSAPDAESLRVTLGTARRSEEESVRQLLEFRRFLECENASLAAQRRSERDLERMTCALQDTERAIVAGRSILESDLEFHLALADATHNFALNRVYRSTRDLLRIMRTTVHQPETDERALAFHRSICEAVRDADPELARRWMEAHLDDLEVTIEQVFRATPDVKRTGSVPSGVDEAVKGSDNSGG